MKTIFYILILFISVSFNKTLIHQKTLPELIVQSDNIIIGQIKNVSDTSLTFQTMETIKGNFEPYITIYKKQKGSYNTRKLYTNTVGQFELIFLSYDSYDKKYEFYTSNGEAECFIRDSLIYMYNRSWYLSKNRQKYPRKFVAIGDTINGDNVEADLYSRNEMCRAIRDYLKDSKSIVQKLLKDPDVKYRFERKSPDKEEIVLKNKKLIEFLNRTKSHERLIDELIDDPQNNLRMGEEKFKW